MFFEKKYEKYIGQWWWLVVLLKKLKS